MTGCVVAPAGYHHRGYYGRGWLWWRRRRDRGAAVSLGGVANIYRLQYLSDAAHRFPPSQCLYLHRGELTGNPLCVI